MKTTGQAGKTHWTPSNASITAPLAHGHHNQRRSIGVFTTDIALKEDPEYFKIVEEFSEDEDKFLEEFAKAWYKLTTRDMGTRARCANTDAPPPQPWQYPLPASDESHSEHWDDVKTTIKSTLLSGSMIIYRMVIVEGRCTKLQLLISYIYNHWLTHKYSEF